MQAVRLARYHTRRSHLVRFCGAYHGWWGDVQPGIGNPVPAHETYTLNDMSERFAARAADAARHRVRPRQSAAGAASERGRAGGRVAGRQLAPRAIRQGRLRRLAQAAAGRLHRAEHRPDLRRSVCRIPSRAWAARRSISASRADLVTYGKTLGGGLPIGVLCGRKDLMRRFRDERPADICFARGTFNSHPYVMAAMHEFLRHLDDAAGMRGLSRPGSGLERAGAAAEPAAAGARRFRCRWRTCPRSGPSATPSPRATIGCCNTICVPKGWR